MLGPLRTLVSVAFLLVLVWAAFAIKLGDRTFAEHIDRIGETEEAKALLDGARSRVRPALDEVKQRVIGEYVEAPTFVPAAPPPPPRRPPARVVHADPEASTAESGRLPGRRLAGALAGEAGDAGSRRPARGGDPGAGARRGPRGGEAKAGATRAEAAEAGKPPGRVGPRGGEAKAGATRAEAADAGKLPGRRARASTN